MPQPDLRDLHHDVLLTNMSIGYRNVIYIADDMLPVLTVTRQSNIIPAYDQSPWFRNDAHLRAPGTRSRGGGFTVGQDTYHCPRYSYRFEIPDEYRDNTDEPFNLDRDGSLFVADKMQLAREIKLVERTFTTGLWGTDKVGGTDFTVWSDYGASNPLVDFTEYMDAVEGMTAREPNRVGMGKQVWNKLRWHPDLVDTIKYTQTGQVTEQIFANLIGINRISIGRALYTTSPPGTPEASVMYQRVWGKHVLMTYAPDVPALLTPSAGYTIVWTRVPNALQYIKRMRDEEREVEIIEGNGYFVHKVTAARSGIFLSGVVA